MLQINMIRDRAPHSTKYRHAGRFRPRTSVAFERTRKSTDFEGNGDCSGVPVSSELVSGKDRFCPLISDFSSHSAYFGTR
jgi:hypothetical protein